MNYAFGEAIRKKIEEKGMTFVAFADRFGVTDRNLQYLFKKKDLSIQQIVRASQILEYDFMSDYLRSLQDDGKLNFKAEEPVQEYAKESKGFTMSFSLSGPQENYYKYFPDLLKIIVTEAKKKGFSIL